MKSVLGGCLAGIVVGFVSPVVNVLLVSPIIVPMIVAYRLDWWWVPTAAPRLLAARKTEAHWRLESKAVSALALAV